MKKIYLYTILMLSGFSKAQSQQIQLKEVNVFPETFAHEIIKKTKKESNKNLISNQIKCSFKEISTKNLTDTIASIKQTSLFKINAFKLKKYKIDVLNGYAKFDDAFFDDYWVGYLEKYMTLNGSINRLFSFEYLDFMNDYGNYKYQIALQNNFYIIDFTSTSSYQGTLKIDKNTFNLLELSFNNLKPISYNYRPSVGSPTKIKYVKEIVNTIKDVDSANFSFNQDDKGKISFSYLESTINYSLYKITKLEHDKENKVKSVEDMKLKHDLVIKAL
jgi:hypothetical protein